MSMKTLRELRVRVVGASAVAMLALALSPFSAGAWLHVGSTTQHPSSGGTWTYGFWDAKVRSYYTVNRCHGSSVSYNGSLVRSANTAAGYKSIAEKSALNYPGADDAYYYRTC